ncbi:MULTISPECIES: S1 family peptidase [unclassified Agarivorans]|uniref:S1 family peptidase n=1 Tax=unclassified Agarivorans TaxID=2636026 RepID=UPI0026E45871|nr:MULTISPECIES: serine protease [unclassified Agarivorans]MDO6687755.1 serine protease [Agarivorans sp. 3_MG-2023]MDO6717244.1 serine protease [Agarivorans sp. 2_MG-2023]
MKLAFIIAIASFLSMFSAGALSDLADTIERIKPSVVGVGTYNKLNSPRANLRGTGFVVGPHLIATNAHVIPKSLNQQQNEKLVVFVGQGRSPEIRIASLVASNRKHDLALLKIEGKALKAMGLSNKKVREGELYAFTGFPIGAVLGLYPVTHRGIISSITPVVIPARNASELNLAQLKRLKSPYNIYQLDATAYPGNSGSPLYHPETGAVIAIINKVFVKTTKEAVLADPSAISYAIPVTHLKQLINSLK